jgi:thiosulfate/3-mercaptopyruvate sulfurtransferase
MPAGPLVSTAWLESHLGEPDLVILDASWYLPTSGRDAAAEYRQRHIPGAVFFDLDHASDPHSRWPHMFPGGDDFARYIGSLGVGPSSRVVAYEGSGTLLSAARAWWMLRVVGHRAVSVLDGGFTSWCAEGRPARQGIETGTPAMFRAALRASEIVTRNEVRDLLAAGRDQVVDMRAAERFQGTAPEPRPGIPSGHMPGSLNLPHTELLAGDGTLLRGDALRRRMAEAGVDPDRPVIASCGSGTSACALLLALETLGTTGHRLYDGSWTEWAGSGMPVEPRV